MPDPSTTRKEFHMIRARKTLQAITVAAVLIASAGCGVGEPGAEGKIAQTADEYLRALADGDGRKACEQLAGSAKAALARPCIEEMRAIRVRVGAAALTAAADRGVEIDVDEGRGSAEVPGLGGARFELVRVGDEWEIASGHALER
jgi:hypothetical protein